MSERANECSSEWVNKCMIEFMNLCIHLYWILSNYSIAGSLLRQGDHLHRRRAALQLDVQRPREGLQQRRRGWILGADWIADGRRWVALLLPPPPPYVLGFSIRLSLSPSPFAGISWAASWPVVGSVLSYFCQLFYNLILFGRTRDVDYPAAAPAPSPPPATQPPVVLCMSNSHWPL